MKPHGERNLFAQILPCAFPIAPIAFVVFSYSHFFPFIFFFLSFPSIAFYVSKRHSLSLLTIVSSDFDDAGALDHVYLIKPIKLTFNEYKTGCEVITS